MTGGLRIAVIQRFLPSRSRGGAGHFTHGLAGALAARGHAVTVFSQDPAPAGARYHVAEVGPGGRLGFLRFPVQVAALDLRGFDVVHAQGDEQWLPRLAGPPVVRTLHGSALAEAVHNGWRLGSARRVLMHGYFYLMERLAAARADAVVAVSADTRRHHPRVSRVIPNGVDVERLAPRGLPRAERPAVLFVGELSTRKRGRLLLDAFRRHVRPALAEAECWCVCPEPAAGPGVRWWQAVDAEALAALYQRAWVFCLPSSYEGFGRPYAEAMAAGTPVLATPNEGAWEVLEGGRCGMIAGEAELGPALVGLLRDADRRARYAARGLHRARRYAWDRVAAEYEAVYESVIRGAARRVVPAGAGRTR